jgi:hypothetical protein
MLSYALVFLWDPETAVTVLTRNHPGLLDLAMEGAS